MSSLVDVNGGSLRNQEREGTELLGGERKRGNFGCLINDDL